VGKKIRLGEIHSLLKEANHTSLKAARGQEGIMEHAQERIPSSYMTTTGEQTNQGVADICK